MTDYNEQIDSAYEIIHEEKYISALKIIREYERTEEFKNKNAYIIIGENYAKERNITCEVFCHHNKGKIIYFYKDNVEISNIHFFEEKKIIVNNNKWFTDLNTSYEFLFEFMDNLLKI